MCAIVPDRRRGAAWRTACAVRWPAATTDHGYVQPVRDRPDRRWSESVLPPEPRSPRSAHRDVMRARIVLPAADGAANAAIAAELGMCEDTVRKWRRRFCRSGPGRAGRPAAPGRPPRVHRRAGGRGQGAGLRAARRDRGAAGPLVAAPSWPPRRSRQRHGPRRSRRPPCAAGWPPMRSSPGSTGPGSSPATRTSRSRPPGCWTSTHRDWEGQPARRRTST